MRVNRSQNATAVVPSTASDHPRRRDRSGVRRCRDHEEDGQGERSGRCARAEAHPGEDSDAGEGNGDEYLTTEDGDGKHRQRRQKHAEMAKEHPRRGEVRVGDEQAAAARPGADSLDELDDEGRGGNKAHRGGRGQAADTDGRSRCSHRRPEPQGGGEDEEIPGIRGDEGGDADAAESRRRNPPPPTLIRRRATPNRGSPEPPAGR